MARVLLVTWDGGGNVPPLLHTGAALRGRASPRRRRAPIAHTSS